MASRLGTVAVALACATGLAACSSIPSGGPARVVRRIPPEGPEPPEPRVERRLAPIPPLDTPPDGIVRNFLIAQGNPADGYAVARNYLAAQGEWNPAARAVVYDERRLAAPRVSDERATVSVTLDPVGTISATGEFRPSAAPVRVTFRLRFVTGVGWRIVDAPPGVLIGADDVATAFQRATLYWPDQARRLVPDLVFLPAGEAPVAAAVRALLGGPRGWLAPAVRTGIPKGTELLDPPAVVDNVVTLNFSREVRGAVQDTLGAFGTFVAQLVWTVTERPDVRVVRLLVEGEPLAVPGRPGLRDHRREDWAEYAPVPATADRRLFHVRGGQASALDDAGRRSTIPVGRPVESLSVNRKGTTLAVVTRPDQGRQSLVVVDLTGAEPPRTVVTADRITPPTWEPGGDVVWAVQTNGAAQQVVAAPAQGGLFTVVDVAGPLPGPITSLRLSPDGARAAVVAGSGRAAQLWVARVERPASGGRVLGQPLRVAPSVRGVTAVAFDGAAHLLAATADGRRPALYRVDVDGYHLEVLRAAGLPAGPVTALAVSAGSPADRVAASAGRLWRRTPGADWAPLPGRGTAPAFAG